MKRLIYSIAVAVAAWTAYAAPHTQGGYSVAEGWRARLIDLDALYGAVGKAESDSGRTSRNHYQLTPRYVRDVERITGKAASRTVYGDKAKQEAAMLEYWNHYGEPIPLRSTSSKGIPISSRY